ncbi:hypothetical protein J056_004135 [Wallemia ichthyophaga EXF-994]|uniref:ATP synthase subunit gamma n=1 Tax=Wallemia ichthyophaga (strain EXF-994 / CBS 113033) TaxID=1299270 RepID=R9AGJ9_WALI9|nr:uncharacterized protein J056_004135 [Wallemia ichthyophaga EXF-994]EOR01349.1 hypothetical protein J056_004135 [Wallemia ichthyophaga EXF-994]TIA73571.1 hypothetical protein E3P91_01352 [Wallemia ichthyophaga]
MLRAATTIRPALKTSVQPAMAARTFSSTSPAAETLREIEQRLKSVKNIEKITKSMKMIASTKLTKAQRAMNTAIQYGKTNSEIFDQSQVQAPENAKSLWIVVSSDSGLCGGIHSSVSKYTKRGIIEEGSEEHPIVILGDRARNQLQRSNPSDVKLSFNQIGKQIPTFTDAAAIADTILTSDIEFDQVNLVYNQYTSQIGYDANTIKAYTEKILSQSQGFKSYEQEEEATKDLAQFSFANAIYAALVEGHASEINARRNAMDNASKNAGEMINNLNLKYNRGRQAQITNELIEVITGASSL